MTIGCSTKSENRFNNSQIFHNRFLGHADTVVRNRQRAVLFIGDDFDLPLSVPLQELGFGQSLEAERINGVAGIADQLAEENLLMGVERVDDDAEDLLQL